MQNNIEPPENYPFSRTLEGLDTQSAVELLRFMVRLRRIEGAIADRYHPEDLMRCPVHFCIGQEAVPGALSVLLNDADYLFSHHRSHGHYLAKSGPLEGLVSELYGKQTGINHGYAGSQDISAPSQRFFAGAILAGSIGIAVGTAFGCRNTMDRVICCFGEGATDQGLFWEAINYAALKKLPILFICENNYYATYSSYDSRVANPDLVAKVTQFGVPSKRVFGNDSIAVFHAVAEGLTSLKEGPRFLETMTYRLSSHVGPEDDSDIYRDRDEVSAWEQSSPITHLEGLLSEQIDLTTTDLAASVDVEIAQAFENALAAPYPNPPDWTNVNITNNDHLLIPICSFSSQETLDQEAIPGPY